MTELLHPDQVFIKKLTDIVLENLENENFGVKELASGSGMSLYRLGKRLHSVNKKTVSQFIREVRLQKAMEMLQNEQYTAAEVAYKVGFGSPAYFTKSFHDFFGFPPGDVKKRGLNNPEANSLITTISKKWPVKSARKSYILTLRRLSILALLFATAGFLIYTKIHNKSDWTDWLASSDGRISIAVMPFRNMTNDTILNVWQEGIQEGIITYLSNNKELAVRQEENINTLLKTKNFTKYAAITPVNADIVSQKLNANLFIYGSIKESGSIINIDAQLISTKTKDVIKSFAKEMINEEKNILPVIDTISERITNFMIISKLIKENPYMQHLAASTSSPEALRYYIYGRKSADNGDRTAAIDWYIRSLNADSNYFDPMLGLSSAYSKIDIDKDLQWVLKYYRKKNQWPIVPQLWASWAYAFSFGPNEEAVKYLKQLQQIDDQEPKVPLFLGYHYINLKQYDKAIVEFEKSLLIRRRWGEEYLKNSWVFPSLGYVYQKTGQYKKAKKLYRSAEKYFKDNPNITDMQAILSFIEKDTTAADRYIKKHISIREKNLSSEADIKTGLAYIYSEAGLMEKAEENYRKALSLEPENPERMNSLAGFLIENNRSLNEVPNLMDKAMELAPTEFEYCEYSDTKGWGLYKLGKYTEAMDILQKTWDSTPFPMYSIYFHLQEVKKVISGKN